MGAWRDVFLASASKTTGQLGQLVMSPPNKQLAVLMILVAVIGMAGGVSSLVLFALVHSFTA